MEIPHRTCCDSYINEIHKPDCERAPVAPPKSFVWQTRDSGVREVMETGSQRDSREGKGRYDLVSPFALERLAAAYERGVRKYGERNWELGQKQMRYFDSAIRHLMQWYMGEDDEDHLAQAHWNTGAMIHQDELMRRGVERYKGLDDRPTYWRD